MAKREPLEDSPESRWRQDGDEKLVLRRREADWTDAERDPELDADHAIRRAAVDVAAAALAAHDGMTGGHSEDVVILCDALATRLGTPRSRARSPARRRPDARPRQGVGAPVRAEQARSAGRGRVAGDARPLRQRAADPPDRARAGRGGPDRAPQPRALGRRRLPGRPRRARTSPSRAGSSSAPTPSTRSAATAPTARAAPAAVALAELRHNAGTQFDPVVVDAIEAEATSLRGSASTGSRR